MLLQYCIAPNIAKLARGGTINLNLLPFNK